MPCKNPSLGSESVPALSSCRMWTVCMINWYTHKTSSYITSSYITSGYQTSGYQTSSYRTSRIQNVQDTKRPGYKTSRIQNVQLPNVQLQNVQDTKRPGHKTSSFCKFKNLFKKTRGRKTGILDAVNALRPARSDVVVGYLV